MCIRDRHDAGLSKTDINMVLLVGGSTRIPAVADKVRQLMGKEPSRNLNPDECVALGAAVQGGKLGNQLQTGSAASEIILMDVTPMSLSIETMGGIASRLIERNTTIPTRHSQIFTTAGNFQTSVDIKVFQGERKFTRDNKLLGNFRLNGIKPVSYTHLDVYKRQLYALSTVLMTSGLRLYAVAIHSPIVFPETVIQSVLRSPISASSFITAYTPPASLRSSMYVGPAGAR